MDVELARWKPRVPRSPAAAVILLDTNTVIWLQQGHPRAARLARARARVYVSPANLLELQLRSELAVSN